MGGGKGDILSHDHNLDRHNMDTHMPEAIVKQKTNWQKQKLMFKQKKHTVIPQRKNVYF